MKRQLCCSLAIALLAAGTAMGRAEGPYHFIKDIPVGGEGGWDYLSVDSQAERLYVSHATKVVVVDLSNDKVVGEIPDTPGIHGVAVAPDLGRGFTSNGRENKVGVINLKTLATLSKVDTGQNPDAILYVPLQKEVYAFNGRSASATVIGAESDKVLTTISLGGKPEFAVWDPDAGRIYNNLEDKSAVAVIDPAKHEVAATWPIAPGESASGMAIDVEHHRLFLGCDNKMMVMMDSSNGKVVAHVPIGAGVDANCFDPATQLAFASCGDGTVTIAHEDSPEKLTVVQTLATEKGARTMIIDPANHKIYLGAAKYEPAKAGQRRPNIVPGSFHILVYGTDKS